MRTERFGVVSKGFQVRNGLKWQTLLDIVLAQSAIVVPASKPTRNPAEHFMLWIKTINLATLLVRVLLFSLIAFEIRRYFSSEFSSDSGNGTVGTIDNLISH